MGFYKYDFLKGIEKEVNDTLELDSFLEKEMEYSLKLSEQLNETSLSSNLIVEKVIIEKKLDKINTFLKTEEYENLSDYLKKVVHRKLLLMTEYFLFLKESIEVIS